jgi:hypothetical protein
MKLGCGDESILVLDDYFFLKYELDQSCFQFSCSMRGEAMPD